MKSFLLIVLPALSLQSPAPESTAPAEVAVVAEAAKAAVAESTTKLSPSKLAQEYFGKLQDGDWLAASSYFDPEALAEFRDMMTPLLELDADMAGPVIAMFLGAELTIEEAKAMDPAEFFARFLENTLAQAESLGQLNFDAVDILGEVPEGHDAIHVVSRSKVSLGEFSMEQMEVLSFRATDQGWKMQLSGKMRGMAQQLQATFGGS